MSFSHLQRRAWVLALTLLAGAVAVVLCYWQGVDRGLMPSPLQPLAARTHAPAAEPVRVAAREPAAAAPLPAAPVPRLSAPTAKPEAPAPAETQTSAPKSSRRPPELGAARPVGTNLVGQLPVEEHIAAPAPEPPVTAAAPSSLSAADQQQAAQWLSNTNLRPVVRVRYELPDILKLVELARGALVASNPGAVHSRELYLLSKPDQAPLFAPYTRNVADRFSTYSLILADAPDLARLTSAFPVYFPGSAAALTFVPDQALAIEIFSQVAKANQSASGETGPAGQTVYEGQLTMRGDQPCFEVLEVRSEHPEAQRR